MQELDIYLDARGEAVLNHEPRLQELGLTVLKTKAATILRPVGGVIDLFDLEFARRDETFSAELIQFLENEIKLSPEAIQHLQQRAVRSGT
jgi:hypothetical protein